MLVIYMFLFVCEFYGSSVVSQQRPLGFECHTEWKVREELFEKWMKYDPYVKETAEEAMAASDQCAAYQTLAYVDFVRNVQSSGTDRYNLPCPMSLMLQDCSSDMFLHGKFPQEVLTRHYYSAETQGFSFCSTFSKESIQHPTKIRIHCFSHLRSNGAWHLHWNPFRLWSTPPLLHCASWSHWPMPAWAFATNGKVPRKLWRSTWRTRRPTGKKKRIDWRSSKRGGWPHMAPWISCGQRNLQFASFSICICVESN